MPQKISLTIEGATPDRFTGTVGDIDLPVLLMMMMGNFTVGNFLDRKYSIKDLATQIDELQAEEAKQLQADRGMSEDEARDEVINRMGEQFVKRLSADEDFRAFVGRKLKEIFRLPDEIIFLGDGYTAIALDIQHVMQIFTALFTYAAEMNRSAAENPETKALPPREETEEELLKKLEEIRSKKAGAVPA